MTAPLLPPEESRVENLLFLFVPLVRSLGAWLESRRLAAPEDQQTRLRDSVRPASSQVQGHSVHLSVEQGCPCLACRSRGPTGEGCDRAGPSSRDEVRVLQPLLRRTQERRWVTTNLGTARSETGPSQAASCLYQGRRGSPCPANGSRHSHSQLPRRLAHPGPVSSTVMRTQGYGAQSPQPVGASGQLGKEQTLPYAEDLFSRHGVGLGQPRL